jgi:type II secretory pathway component PulM
LQRLRAQVPVKQETLNWMQREAQNVAPLMARKQQQPDQDGTPLLTVVESTAKQANIHGSIRRISPGEENEVKIWLTDATFENWLQWLEVLRQRNVEVASATVNRATNNKVTIRVTVVR